VVAILNLRSFCNSLMIPEHFKTFFSEDPMLSLFKI
jgi:hypothetical protein